VQWLASINFLQAEELAPFALWALSAYNLKRGIFQPKFKEVGMAVHCQARDTHF
jgi:hypothetical protein